MIRGMLSVFKTSDLPNSGITMATSSSSIRLSAIGGRLTTTQLGRTGLQVRVRRVGLTTCATSSIGLTDREQHVSSLHRRAQNIPIIMSKSALFCFCTGQKKSVLPDDIREA